MLLHVSACLLLSNCVAVLHLSKTLISDMFFVCANYIHSCIFIDTYMYIISTLTNQNSIQEEIKSRLKLSNACYYSVQNLFSSSLLSKNLKIKIHRTIILLVVLYGCEAWSPTLREERRLEVFENRTLRRIFGPKRDEITRKWRKLHNEELNGLYS